MPKDYADEHAETLVLPPSGSPLRAEPAETDPLALYEEYARTMVDALVPPADAAARRRG